MPTERAQHARQRERDRAESVSSHDGGVSSTLLVQKEKTESNRAKSSEQLAREQESLVTHKSCYCGVVSLLECVPSNPGDSRLSKRALRSKHREFNSRAQKSWGRVHRGSGGAVPKKHSKSASNIEEGHESSNGSSLRHCHQPKHLPLPLNPSTRVTFAYELTSIAIVIDASPSATAATFFNRCDEMADGCCVPLDRLGSILKAYLKGLVQPIEVPPVSVSGVGIAFGRWTPNLAITVVAAYPPTHRDRELTGLLVRDFRVVDEESAVELVDQVERWVLHDVEEVIADRLSGGKSQFGNGLGGRSSQGSGSMKNHLPATSRTSSWTTIRSSMKDILTVGDAALATLPSEGRPVILVISDCLNVSCGGVFDYLAETSRSDVPINVINLSNPTLGEDESAPSIYSSFPLNVSDDSKSIGDTCHQSGGIFIDSDILSSYATNVAGFSSCVPSPFHADAHFTSKKRSIRPNALQWYTLFSLSPLTPGYSLTSPAHSMNLFRSSTKTKLHQSQDSLNSFGGMTKYLSLQSFETSKSVLPTSNKELSFSTQAAALNERTFFVKYNINPVRVKSLLMSRILEGYRARRYGQNTQDPGETYSKAQAIRGLKEL